SFAGGLLMFGFDRYNYESFDRSVLLKDRNARRGPDAGDVAPDFTLRTLEGHRVSLSDFEERKNVVVTFGSATCPMTAASIAGLNRLYKERSSEDVQFLFIYVREAHPGECIGAHEELSDKVRAAHILAEEEAVEIPILIDDLRGSVHRKYGKMPNA